MNYGSQNDIYYAYTEKKIWSINITSSIVKAADQNTGDNYKTCQSNENSF